jgi:hypothetical protein
LTQGLKCDTSFDAPEAHFDHLSLFSDAQAKKVGNQKKKCENIERANKNQIESHEIEPNLSKDSAMHEGDNPLFLDEFIVLNIPNNYPKVRSHVIKITC